MVNIRQVCAWSGLGVGAEARAKNAVYTCFKRCSYWTVDHGFLGGQSVVSGRAISDGQSFLPPTFEKVAQKYFMSIVAT